MISYRRLSPVSLVDPLLVETGADAALELRLPSFTCPAAADATQSDKRASVHATHELIFTHQLFPIIPPGITATDLPPEVWTSSSPEAARRMWCEHVASEHYAPYEDRRSPLELQGEGDVRDGLGIFGRSCNPLDSVVAFSATIKDTNVLMHYMAVVVMQYYLVKRGGFMRVRTDIEARHFSDALPPYVFVMFRESDCRMPKQQQQQQEDVTYDNAARLVMELPFPAFLLGVFRWMQNKYRTISRPSEPQAANSALKHNALDPFKDFCETKLHKNWIQFLNCTRFREFFPDGWQRKIAESRAQAGGKKSADDLMPDHKRKKCYQ